MYTLEEFEHADTHDKIWNAAQHQLVREGRIHNYLRMLWGKMLDDVPAYVDRLSTAVAAGDAASAVNAAHAIKGLALNLGFTALGEASKDLEQAAKAGQPPLAPLLDRIRETERRTRAWVEG